MGDVPGDGLLYADMHQAAKKREAFTMGFNPLQLLAGLISKQPDKSGHMPSDVVVEEAWQCKAARQPCRRHNQHRRASSQCRLRCGW